MKKIAFLLLTFLAFICSFSQQRTMTFNSGASEPGFTFVGWAGSGGTIWVNNLAIPATITSNSGSFDFQSFEVGPFLGLNNMQVTSDSGHSYTYTTDSARIHVLNWTGMTSLTFTRLSGGGASADHDNFKYSFTTSCVDPDIPTLRSSTTTICERDSAIISISGNLNDATHWFVYTDSCGGTFVDSTSTNSITVWPRSHSTTYYFRGEDGTGCVDETMGLCDSITISLATIDTSTSLLGLSITANATADSYQWIDCNNGGAILPNDTNQTYTGTIGGSYAVILTKNGCTDTSACVNLTMVGIEESILDNIRIYPNPINEKVNIGLNNIYESITLRVKSINGQLIYSNDYHQTNKIELAIEGSIGIYIIELISKEESAVFKLVKEAK